MLRSGRLGAEVNPPANMFEDFSAYPDWKAPGEDSGLIIWPDPHQFLADTLDNHRRLSGEQSFVIHGVPLAELRRRQRGLLNLEPARPLIGSGHQVELFHAGVWAKLAMMGAAAARIDADSIFIAVDTDAPKHLNLRWPGFSQSISDDPRSPAAQWTGLLGAPAAGYLGELKSLLNDASAQWPFVPMALEFLDDLARQSPPGTPLSESLTGALHHLDRDLGLRHQAMVASPMWFGEPYLIFAHHLLASADRFAGAYNQALHEYRVAQGIAAPGWPMPDLSVGEANCEAPFWIDDLAAQSRTRASVVRDGAGWALHLQGDAFVLNAGADATAGAGLGEFLRRHNTRLSPRALTLTMFLRLVLVDQFIHGIGGGRYDQVNDRIIHRFFSIDPPAFSVTTATLYFPTVAGRRQICLPCLAHQAHQLRHRVMGEKKMQLVHQIETLPRRSQQRQRIFTDMHRRLAEAAVDDPRLRQGEQTLAGAVRQHAREQNLFDRELFYAIQPRDRLAGLIERYASRFAP